MSTCQEITNKTNRPIKRLRTKEKESRWTNFSCFLGPVCSFFVQKGKSLSENFITAFGLKTNLCLTVCILQKNKGIIILYISELIKVLCGEVLKHEIFSLMCYFFLSLPCSRKEMRHAVGLLLTCTERKCNVQLTINIQWKYKFNHKI